MVRPIKIFSPPKRQPRGKLMVSLVNSHTNATRIGRHRWEIDLKFAPGLPLGWFPSIAKLVRLNTLSQRWDARRGRCSREGFLSLSFSVCVYVCVCVCVCVCACVCVFLSLSRSLCFSLGVRVHAIQAHGYAYPGSGDRDMTTILNTHAVILYEAGSPFGWIESEIAQCPKSTSMTCVLARGGPVPKRSSHQ